MEPTRSSLPGPRPFVKALAVGAALALAGGIAACGGGDAGTDVVVPPAPQPEADPYAEERYDDAPPSRPERFVPNVTIREHSEKRDGTSVALTLALAEPVDAADFDPPRGFQRLVDACDIDRRRALVVPARLRIRNTTKGFSIEWLQRITVTHRGKFSGARRSPLYVTFAQGFSDNEACRDWESSANQPTVLANLSPRGKIVHNLLIIVNDYYRPNAPDGDPQSFARLRVRLGSEIPLADPETVCSSVTGPSDGRFVTLDGSPPEGPSAARSPDLPPC